MMGVRSLFEGVEALRGVRLHLRAAREEAMG